MTSADPLAVLEDAARAAGFVHPFQTAAVLRAMADTYRVGPRVLADSGAVVPAFEIASRFGGRRLSSALFQFIPQPVGDPATVARLFFTWAADHGYSVAELAWVGEGGEPPTGASESRLSVTADLPLDPDPERLLAGMQSGLRSDLRRWTRKAEASRLRIGAGDDGDLVDWYRLLVRLYRDKHRTMAQPASLFRRLTALGPTVCELRMAWDGDAPAAGILLLKSADHWEYAWSAARAAPVVADDGAKVGVIPLLIWSAVQDAAAAGAKTFGFGSSQIDNLPLREFKQHWGCLERPVRRWSTGAAPAAADRVGWAADIYARLPMPLVTRLPELLVPMVV